VTRSARGELSAALSAGELSAALSAQLASFNGQADALVLKSAGEATAGEAALVVPQWL
jgi:hypothetical protein